MSRGDSGRLVSLCNGPLPGVVKFRLVAVVSYCSYSCLVVIATIAQQIYVLILLENAIFDLKAEDRKSVV